MIDNDNKKVFLNLIFIYKLNSLRSMMMQYIRDIKTTPSVHKQKAHTDHLKDWAKWEQAVYNSSLYLSIVH